MSAKFPPLCRALDAIKSGRERVSIRNWDIVTTCIDLRRKKWAEISGLPMLGCLAILLMRELIVCECTGLPFLLGEGNKNVVFNDWAYAYNEAPTDK